MKHLLALVALSLLSGCAGSYTEPTWPADHPANPDAPAGAAAAHSRTLDLTDSDPIEPGTPGDAQTTPRMHPMGGGDAAPGAKP